MLLQVLLSSLLLFANYVIAAASYPTCAMYRRTELSEEHSFFSKIYELSYTEPVGQIYDELLSYQTKDGLGGGEIRGSYDVSFNISIPPGEVYRGNFQGKENVLLSHMVATFFTELIVPETGEYTFSFDGVSDGAAMFILDDLDKLCCENFGNTLLQGIDAFSKFFYIPEDPNYQTKSITFNLVAGMVYELLFSYVNHGGDAIFVPTMTTPSGEVTTNFKGYIYDTNDGFCEIGNSTSSSVVSQWSETYATTSTTIMTNVKTVTEMGLPYTEIETVYYVMTPAPTSASSSEAAVPSSLLSSSFLSESTLASSSVILLSVEKTSAVSSQQSSTTSSSVSLSSEKSSLTPSSTIPPFTSSSTTSHFTSSSAISETALSANKTERVSSTVSDAVTSSVVSSSEEASVSSFTQSSKILSSVHTVLSNLDGDSSTKQLTKSAMSSVFNNATSGSTTSTSVSMSSNANVFSNSSITEGSTRSSTNYPLTKSTQSISSAESSGDAGQSGSENYLTTSTYTDVYGMTRTTTVRCSTQSGDINPTSESHMPEVTVVTVTSCSNKKCETVVSTVTHPTDLTKTTVTGKLNQQGAATSPEYSGASAVASVAVQLQSSRGSSSATHTVQQAPNAAGKYTVGLLFSIVPIAFPLFFM